MSLLRAARVDGAARTDSTAAQGDGGDRGGSAQGGGGQGRTVIGATRRGGTAAVAGARGRTRAAREEDDGKGAAAADVRAQSGSGTEKRRRWPGRAGRRGGTGRPSGK